MSGAHPEPTEPRIIKKKKVQGGGAHGGAWKVAYADFVTAMMALFIVLWIMGQSQAVRQNVAQYFKNPGLLPGAAGLMETSDMGGEMPTPGHSQELQTPSPITPDLASQVGSLEEVKKRISEVIAQLPELSRLKDQVALEITDEGLRIELLDKENSHFFDLGSANLKPETQEVLKVIARELGKVPNRVGVEGHTDSRPYGSRNYTNWELSADRANAARRLMEDGGVKPGQVVSVRGCADRQLRNSKDPLDFQNRRVSIMVMFQGQTRQEPLDLKKIEEDLHKSPEKSAPPATPAVPETKISGAGASPSPPAPPEKPPASNPAGRTSLRPAPSQGAPPQEALALNPGSTPGTPAPAPVYQAPVATPAPRLEDSVQDEVRQLLQQQQAKSPAAPHSPAPGQEPRTRLGW